MILLRWIGRLVDELYRGVSAGDDWLTGDPVLGIPD